MPVAERVSGGLERKPSTPRDVVLGLAPRRRSTPNPPIGDGNVSSPAILSGVRGASMIDEGVNGDVGSLDPRALRLSGFETSELADVTAVEGNDVPMWPSVRGVAGKASVETPETASLLLCIASP